MEPSEMHVNTCGFFYDDSRITVPMQLKSAMCLVKILFKRATFRVLSHAALILIQFPLPIRDTH
jgi:hypothetical protein